MLLILPMIVWYACSKDPAPSPPPPPADTTVQVTGLTIEPGEFFLAPSLTRQLTVSIIPANAGNKNLSWSSSNTSVASVSASGVVTAVGLGTATITAISNDNSSVKATTQVAVLKNYEVYAVGKGSTPSWSRCALYWKNGVQSELAGGLAGGYPVASEAFAIVLSDNDVFIAGNTTNEGLWNIPTYWKNGVPKVVGDPKAGYNSYTRAIAVNGSKVYLSGYAFYNSECPAYCFGRSRAAYFVDDAGTTTQIPLYNNISSTRAFGLVLKGQDVIIAGSQANDNQNTWATYWKNSVTDAVPLSPITGYCEATAVALQGTDLVFAGYNKNIAQFWTGDLARIISLTDGSREARASCMAVSGNIIYVAGYEKNEAGRDVAKYWKIDGNTVSARTLSDGAKSTVVNGLAVSGDDLFLVGSELSDAGVRKATCWRAYEGLSTPAYLDLSETYVAGGTEGYGIYIR